MSERIQIMLKPEGAAQPTPQDVYITSFGPSDVNVPQNKFKITGHGLTNGDEIRLVPAINSTPPAPLNGTTHYFVINATANDFQVSLTTGGAAIVITNSGTGTTAIVLVTDAAPPDVPTTLVLVKEDGTGLPNSNAYANVADANAYFLGHLYADAWNNSSDDVKAQALVMATRNIDAFYIFGGWRVSSAQALQWPRYGVVNEQMVPPALMGTYPLALAYAGFTDVYWPSNVVPKGVMDATCEYAGQLMQRDWTANYGAQGIAGINLGQSALAVNFNTSNEGDRPEPIPDVVAAMLAPFGTGVSGGGGMVPVRRA